MLKKFVQIWKIKDLRNSILFVLAMLAIFRLVAHIPIPGVDVKNLKEFFQNNQLLGLLNILSGGGMENFSLVMMGVAPYITASIILQLLAMIVPSLEELQKEGEYGQKKINQYTRILAVPLSIIQGFGMIQIFRSSSRAILGNLTNWDYFIILISVTAGTMFLMWIGELISEKKIGNGISLLIFAGIISGLPNVLLQIIYSFDQSQLINMIIFAAIAVATIIVVVLITEGQRNVPVSYAKRIRGMRMYGGMDTHLPLRVNMAGVIPIIFAVSIVLMPSMIANFFVRAKTAWLANSANFILTNFKPGSTLYVILYFFLVFGFTFFYTYVIFHPQQIAENLQKQGGFIPGIRPGKPTAEYLNYTVNRIILLGALFLAAIAVLPMALQGTLGLSTVTIGGTGLLIVVSVVIETVKQVESQLTMREYEGF